MYTLEEYCRQSKSKLISTTGIKLDSVIASKLDILIRASQIYFDKKLISEETMNILKDPRFARLYRSKVSDLKGLLAINDLIAPEQNKPSIISFCYRSGMDIKTNNNSNNSSSEEINIDDVNTGTFRFFRNNNKIYLGSDKTSIEIDNSMLIELFKLLLPI